MWCANPTESGTYTLLLGKNSRDTPKSAFTTRRLKCGTVEERALMRSTDRGSQDGRPQSSCVGGDTSLPRREQGLVILGAPVGQVFVKAQLEKKAAEHSVLLQRIPLVENLQAAWLLLSFCVSPELGEACPGHDDSVRACLGSLLNVDVAHVPSFAQMMTNLPLHMGGLGFRSAVRLHPAAHWASWADTVAVVQERHPEVATILVEHLTHHTVRRQSAASNSASAGWLVLVSSCPHGIDWLRGNVQALPMMTKGPGVVGNRRHW